MSFSSYDVTALGTSPSPPTANQREDAAVRKMAADFEALLLRQLTSSINKSDDDEEGDNSLFGNGGGIGLSRQLFSEQMADTMAQNGGVGLADMILQQVQANRGKKPAASPNPETARALDAARFVREATPAKAERNKAPDRAAEVTPASTAKNKADGNKALSDRNRNYDPVIISLASDEDVRPAARPNASSAALPSNSAVNSIEPDEPMTSQDVASMVRPRRVFPLRNTEKSSAASNTIPTYAYSRLVVNAPDASETTGTRVSAEPVKLQMFVKGPVRSVFGKRIDPINGRLRFHTGIDIAAPQGTPIGAAAEGRVVFAGPNRGYGNMVIIEHPDGTRTRYGHAARLLVQVGDSVEAGQTIATVGSTGHSTGPHLHFEVMRNGQFINPVTVLPKDFALVRR